MSPSFSERNICSCPSKLSRISSFSLEKKASISLFSILHLLVNSLLISSIIRRFSTSIVEMCCFSLCTSLWESLYFFCQLFRTIFSCPIFISYSWVIFVVDVSFSVTDLIYMSLMFFFSSSKSKILCFSDSISPLLSTGIVPTISISQPWPWSFIGISLVTMAVDPGCM